MLSFRLSITADQRKALHRQLATAQQLGDGRLTQFILALLAVAHYQSTEQAAVVLQLSVAQVEAYVHKFVCYGVAGVAFKKSSGRKPRLSAGQRQELARLIDAGPQACGFTGACWRSPLIQQLIKQRFSVTYNVFYIAQLLRNLGFSFQKARFVSDHLDELRRRQWRQQTWPEALRVARAQAALLLFGDEASFPQWGTLCYTWARRGQQPEVKTCGKRKGYKIFGLIDYFTGRFFYQGTTGKLESASYQAFLAGVLEQTPQPIVLIQDGARYHTSAALRAFFAQHAARLQVFQLPSYSPDFNPIEQLWKKIKEQDTHLHYFPTFESLMARVDCALVKFADCPNEILALFGVAAGA